MYSGWSVCPLVVGRNCARCIAHAVVLRQAQEVSIAPEPAEGSLVLAFGYVTSECAEHALLDRLGVNHCFDDSLCLIFAIQVRKHRRYPLNVRPRVAAVFPIF